MITYLTLILAIPTGIILYLLTKKEKNIYSKYFPILLWSLAILSAIFLTINKEMALPLIFIFLTVLTWNNLPLKK